MSSQLTPDHTPSSSVRDKVADLTFAVELKFLLRQDLEAVTRAYGPNVRRFIAHRPQALRDSMTASETQLWQDNWDAIAAAIGAIPGVDATSKHHMQEQRTDLWKTHWMVYKANSACPPYMTYFEDDPDRPVFDTEAPDYDKFVWTPVEICSPILSWSRKTEALETLTAVLDTLNRHFDIVANASTECHVHVGRADGEFYTLTTLKKLATLFWLAEPLLRAVKDPESPNFDHHYTWSYAMRENSRLGTAIGANKAPLAANGTHHHHQTLDDLATGSPDAFDAFRAKLFLTTSPHPAAPSQQQQLAAALDPHHPALRTIWRAASGRELAYMLRGSEGRFRRLGFNFYALLAPEGGPRTIEVRFLEGFIDGQVVPAWVRLCGALIDVVADPDQRGVEGNTEFYGVVAALLRILEEGVGAPGEDAAAALAAFLHALGAERVPEGVAGALVEVVRGNYPPRG